MLTEMTHTEIMTYSTGGMEHPELSTTIHGLRPSGSTGPRRRKIWVLEGGYTADTRHFDKVEEKQSQHAQLMHALQIRGFDAKLMVLTFGVGATIYQQAAEDVHVLGVKMSSVKKNTVSHTSAPSRMCREHHHAEKDHGQAKAVSLQCPYKTTIGHLATTP